MEDGLVDRKRVVGAYEQLLAREENLASLAKLNRELVARAEGAGSPKGKTHGGCVVIGDAGLTTLVSKHRIASACEVPLFKSSVCRHPNKGVRSP